MIDKKDVDTIADTIYQSDINSFDKLCLALELSFALNLYDVGVETNFIQKCTGKSEVPHRHKVETDE